MMPLEACDRALLLPVVDILANLLPVWRHHGLCWKWSWNWGIYRPLKIQSRNHQRNLLQTREFRDS